MHNIFMFNQLTETVEKCVADNLKNVEIYLTKNLIAFKTSCMHSRHI